MGPGVGASMKPEVRRRCHRCKKSALLGALKNLTDASALQQLAHGSKEVKLSNGETVTVPAALLVKVAAATYAEYEAVTPKDGRLSRTQFLLVAKAISSGKVDPQAALDPIVMKAGRAFRALLSLFDELTDECEAHLKGFTTHLAAARQSCGESDGGCDGCADHCLCYAFDHTLPGVCPRPHPRRCVDCSRLAIVEVEIEALVKDALDVADPQPLDEAAAAAAAAQPPLDDSSAAGAGPPPPAERPRARPPVDGASAAAGAPPPPAGGGDGRLGARARRRRRPRRLRGNG
ncbi:hypothetical protein M885DRAFT_526400 [Pelagophyceae sp. CCMP2097]|nr:hypothetical protein M885DRAFT_526400 [Pelagophyceae sp. CCMP2097]